MNFTINITNITIVRHRESMDTVYLHTEAKTAPILYINNTKHTLQFMTTHEHAEAWLDENMPGWREIPYEIIHRGGL